MRLKRGRILQTQTQIHILTYVEPWWTTRSRMPEKETRRVYRVQKRYTFNPPQDGLLREDPQTVTYARVLPSETEFNPE